MKCIQGLLVCLMLAVAAPVHAHSITPAEALERARSEGLIIVDVRQPPEWQETGVVPGAHLIPMRHPQGAAGLVADFDELVGGDRSQPVALICRTGNRSALVQQYLQQQGFSAVINITEGMAGDRHGPGWLARELPTAPCSVC